MNLILLETQANIQNLPAADRRAEHIRKILLKDTVDRLYVGVAGGAMGMAKASVLGNGDVKLDIEWQAEPEGSGGYPLILLVGLSRPQTCRKILRDAACLGIRELVFYRSEKGEPAYASSSLWKSDEWERQLHEGIEQAFDTHLPVVEQADSLEEAIGEFRELPVERIALDNYEATMAVADTPKDEASVLLAVGSERGFSAGERDTLRANGFTLAHLGSRVLRTETAIVAGCSVIASVRGWHCESYGG